MTVVRKAALNAQKRTQQRKRTPRRHAASGQLRRRATGPSAAVRDLVWIRAKGRCEGCGVPLGLRPRSWHHRQPRGMGGTRGASKVGPSCLLLVCGHATTPGSCHQWAEQHRSDAEGLGWIVRRPTPPAAVPVRVWQRGWVRLDDDGTYLEEDA